MFHIDFLTYETVDRLSEVHEGAVGPASRLTAKLDLDVAVPTNYIFGMEEIVYGAGVVGNWIVKVL